MFCILSLNHDICVSAFQQNITIDDTNGDPFTGEAFVYTPADLWTIGQDCECPPGINPNEIPSSTWHVSTFSAEEPNIRPNATVTFRGTALYVYCILTAAFADSNMTFYLDGQPIGSYSYSFVEEEQPVYHYSVPVIQLGSLSDENHTFSLINGLTSAAAGRQSLVILDYIQYT
ncbi:hypothetical protein OBBRIDRAFT_726268 [Obba rivulosa]|uniref:Uncharacterized protein n=1 Tax=Obba rivulosa TaxID=1052685 RepID=A0A8E2AXE3_9APHY|nr:hypothetical protein OBBRIDRAFT_726268 [Obba rivulosa]